MLVFNIRRETQLSLLSSKSYSTVAPQSLTPFFLALMAYHCLGEIIASASTSCSSWACPACNNMTALTVVALARLPRYQPGQLKPFLFSFMRKENS